MQVSPEFPTDNPAVTAIPLREDIAPDGLLCTVSGWGLLGDPEETRPEILQVVSVPFISHETCGYIYRNYTEGSIEPGMNCAGYIEGGKDACGVSVTDSVTVCVTILLSFLILPGHVLRRLHVGETFL